MSIICENTGANSYSAAVLGVPFVYALFLLEVVVIDKRASLFLNYLITIAWIFKYVDYCGRIHNTSFTS